VNVLISLQSVHELKQMILDEQTMKTLEDINHSGSIICHWNNGHHWRDCDCDLLFGSSNVLETCEAEDISDLDDCTLDPTGK
jgi:hypothetical protein